MSQIALAGIRATPLRLYRPQVDCAAVSTSTDRVASSISHLRTKDWLLCATHDW